MFSHTSPPNPAPGPTSVRKHCFVFVFLVRFNGFLFVCCFLWFYNGFEQFLFVFIGFPLGFALFWLVPFGFSLFFFCFRIGFVRKTK